MRQLANYHEALRTIHDVTEMSSDDVLENADFAFLNPELTLHDGEWQRQRALWVGLTLRAIGKAFEKLPNPPLSKEEMLWLARAAAVFSRRFEALASPKELTPDFSPAAARETLAGILPEVTSPHITLLVSSALGRGESLHRYGNYSLGLRSPDSLTSASYWAAFAEAFPLLLDHRSLLRQKIIPTLEGKHLFVEREAPRWLNEKHVAWFQPERLLSEIRLFFSVIEYFREQGMVVDQNGVSGFIRETQEKVLSVLSKRPDSKHDQRRKLENLYFQLEEFIPEFHQLR